MLTPKEHTQVLSHITKRPTAKLPLFLNSLLFSLRCSAAADTALRLYAHILRHHSAAANGVTFGHALAACHPRPPAPASSSLLNGAVIHAHVLKSGHAPDLFVRNSLVGLYSSHACVGSALSAFSETSEPDVVGWNSVVSALARNGLEIEAVMMFTSMGGGSAVRPDATTLVSVLSACASLREIRVGRTVHGYGSKIACGANVILDNATLNMYMSCGDVVSARNLFDEMSHKDVVSWTTMISGYARNPGCCGVAVDTFQSMLRCGEAAPNEASLVSVLRACGSMGSLSLGMCLHAYVVENEDLVIDGRLGNALLNMYAKCGDVHMALRVFHSLPTKDLVSWSTIIGGMAFAGRARTAILAFSSMLRHGIRPDGVVFLSVLSACCHTGRVDHGRMFFEALGRGVYDTAPRKEHYNCMVDMLGRAGRLEEAESMLGSMPPPVELDPHLVGALLNACKLHGDDERRKALEKVIVGGAVVEGGGLSALLSNTFAGVGEWTSSVEVRELMAARGVRKAVGCSWTEQRR